VSLIRWGNDGSHVYVYWSTRGLECCFCDLEHPGEYEDFTADGTEKEACLKMASHLRAHVTAGEHVPPYVIAALEDWP